MMKDSCQEGIELIVMDLIESNNRVMQFSQITYAVRNNGGQS